MDTLLELCKLALQTGGLQWGLEDLVDDLELDNISPGLRQLIKEGNIKIPAFCPTISIDDIESPDIVHLSCVSGYTKDTRTVKMTKLVWNLDQVKAFLTYLRIHDISVC